MKNSGRAGQVVSMVKRGGGWERWPRRKSLDGLYDLCRWCAKPLKPPQTAWCSRECESEVIARCNWPSLCAVIFKRDKGICQGCGINLADVEEFFSWYEKILRKYSTNPPGSGNGSGTKWYNSEAWRGQWPYVYELRHDLGYGQGHLYEVNHKVAISEGGDPADPENLELLCLPCHKKHTAALRKRLANVKKSTVH
jgi:5-methylcytosine-specific restriction enzyme A